MRNRGWIENRSIKKRDEALGEERDAEERKAKREEDVFGEKRKL